MKIALTIVQIVVSVLLVVAVLLQNKGGGIGMGLGSGSEQYRSRRGVEELLHRGTILLAFLFFAISVANLFV